MAVDSAPDWKNALFRWRGILVLQNSSYCGARARGFVHLRWDKWISANHFISGAGDGS